MRLLRGKARSQATIWEQVEFFRAYGLEPGRRSHRFAAWGVMKRKGVFEVPRRSTAMQWRLYWWTLGWLMRWLERWEGREGQRGRDGADKEGQRGDDHAESE